MAKELKDQKIFVFHILDAMTRIKSHTLGVSLSVFLKTPIIQDAVTRQLEIIGEAARHFTKEIQEATPNIHWRDIVDMRNKLAHDYFNIDLIIVWDTVIKDLPKFEKEIKSILEILP